VALRRARTLSPFAAAPVPEWAKSHLEGTTAIGARQPIDGESFQTYVEKVLVPTLRPDDIIIMDNLGSHKGEAIRRLICAAGAKLIFLANTRPT
jgi:transposase